MHLQYASTWVFILAVLLVFGCRQPDEPADPGHGAAGEDGEEHAGHDHGHEGDQELVWRRQSLEHEGYHISLGHHGRTLHEGDKVEPAVQITKDGADVADAKVFVMTVGDQTSGAAQEQAMTYEPATDDQPARYAQVQVQIPKGARQITLRYRIELSEAAEFSRDVVLDVEQH